MKGIKTSFTVSFVVKMKGIKTSFTDSFVVKMKGIKISFTVSFVNWLMQFNRFQMVDNTGERLVIGSRQTL